MGKKVLVSFDTDRIKDYIFATGKLKEIRGASAILDELNRWDMVQKAHKFHAETIYANGGSGMFVVPDTSTESLMYAVEKEYRLRTLTGSITSANIDLPDGFTDQDSVKSYLKTLAYRLRLNKDKNTSNLPVLTHPFLKTCDSCGNQYAGQNVTDPEFELLCGSCKNKREKNSEIKKDIDGVTSGEAEEDIDYKLWYRLLGELARSGYEMTGKSRPEDFDDLGEMSIPKNYMGLIYADGDNMGKALEQCENLNEVKKFSKVVDDAVYEAVYDAIFTDLHFGDKYFPFDILMLGGDDLVMLTPAHKVMEVSMKIAEKFSELTEQHYGKRFTLSVGVAIAHTKFPFSSLLRLAEQALKFSKKEAVKRRFSKHEFTTEGLINFIVVNNSNSLDFDAYYDANYKDTLSNKDSDFYRTLRPYSIKDLQYIIKTIRCLKAKDFPRGKLSKLRNSVFQSRNQSILEGLMFFSRIIDETHQHIFKGFLTDFATVSSLPCFPWFKEGEDYYSPFLDLIELYDFIET